MRTRSFVVFVLVLVIATACSRNNKEAMEPHVVGEDTPAALQRALGLTLLETGQARGALPYLQRLVRLEPDQPAAHCYLSRAYMDLGMWQQAGAALDRALALQPRYAPAHGLRGVLLDSQGQHEAALVAHRRAVSLDPRNAAYHGNVGFSLYLAGRYVDALAAYDRALQVGPSTARLHNNIGFALGKLARFDEAAEHFRLGGTTGEAANNLGLVYEDRGQLERAYDAYAAAVGDMPELEAARGNLERISKRLGRPVPIAERRE